MKYWLDSIQEYVQVLEISWNLMNRQSSISYVDLALALVMLHSFALNVSFADIVQVCLSETIHVCMHLHLVPS